MNPVNLSGRIALITGASRGIGAAVAKAYAKAGGHVVLLARTTGALEALDDEIRQTGGQATLIPMDLRNPEPLDNLGPLLMQKFGRLDIFVGNAGMLGTLTPVAHQKAGEWEKVLNVNLNANFRLVRTLDPLLRASDAGRAIFVTSSAAEGRAYWGAYGISKAALEALARTWASETEKTSLRVNLVDPGGVRTAMRAEAFPGEDKEALPLPETVVPVFLELASSACVKHGETVRCKDKLKSRAA
jgi:NAD(P)-dependent dehydrogenase (short-subunit alcohol dehydrogenase family)